MNVCVFGLWHLGTVTAACLASGGHDVTGLDTDPALAARLSAGQPPVFEPGLEDLLKAGLASGRLHFTTDAAAAVGRADVVWICDDTPVDDDDRGDVEYVVSRTAALLPHLAEAAIVLISSQVPVGTTRRLEALSARSRGSSAHFAYSPENLRLGKAIESFTRPDRAVVGVRSDRDRTRVAELLGPFTRNIEWMSVESAEMTKHALNAFLATSVTFINEIATICEQVGANARDVERGLKSEARIGPKAYLMPGDAIAGGTLARDVMFLSALGSAHDVSTPLLSSVKASNDAHRGWARRRLTETLGTVRGRTIAVWGLTYKPGTDTLRRSSAIALCHWLHAEGATVQAHDPAITDLPPDLAAFLRLAETPGDAAAGASALVVATPWPEYRRIDARAAAARMTRRLVLDAGRFLADAFAAPGDVEYMSVGSGVAAAAALDQGKGH